MKFLPYLLKHLRRNWFRTGLTVLAMALCIFLFCTLQSVLAEIDALLDSTSAKRLVTRNSVSIVFDLPIAYGARILSVPGVER
ncbi:MAG TPA: ABC transporter permease, partial [Vicinamibacteria bacterium]|nr:ABC transporter permease [Vicinamibacteria bacterium]